MAEHAPKKELKVEQTPIPGLLIIHLPIHGDSRGWFKENWQREKMIGLGLPDFHPVQNNVSYNASRGATRGVHTEPWDKLVSVSHGRVFAAWVDMREGNEPNVFYTEIGPDTAVFVPRGVGNSYQALENDSVYSYLVNEHWRPDATYLALNLADPTIDIPWPIPLTDAEISPKDQHNPFLAEAERMAPKKVLVTGCSGQLGIALRHYFPTAEYVDMAEFNISEPEAYSSKKWSDYSAIINAGAYTNVDGAETPEGRIAAWKANATALGCMARVAADHNLTVVHVSSDYVFDGTQSPHTEDEPFSPLSVYGASKAAGDIAIEALRQHYIVRTSWVVGSGNNFVKTIKALAQKGVKPSVVNDQLGRLTFADDLAGAIHHLLSTKAPFGTYNFTNDGKVVGWAEIAKLVYEQTGYNPDDVSGVSTAEYYAGKQGIAPRPLRSELDLTKIKSTGLSIADWQERLRQYLEP